MKKRFLSVLLTLFMVLMMLPTTAYAGRAYCETCGKWVGTTSTYEYKDGGYHWEHVSCAECGTNISNPRKNIIGVERQLAQADRLVQFAVGHLIQIHSDTTTKAL